MYTSEGEGFSWIPTHSGADLAGLPTKNGLIAPHYVASYRIEMIHIKIGDLTDRHFLVLESHLYLHPKDTVAITESKLNELDTDESVAIE